MKQERRLRWAIFTASVLSTVDNPDAHLWRALGARLHSLDVEAVFYEPRGNQALRALLQRSGAGALTAFRAQFPDIEYRTLEPRHGADLVEWMTRILATADVAIIQSTATPDLINWLGKLTRRHLQTFYLDSGWNEPRESPDELTDQLSGYTAVLVGHDRLVERYEGIAAGTRVLSFGPLPSDAGLEQPSHTEMMRLEQACERLIDAVSAARMDVARNSDAQIGPNGHRT